VRAKTNAAVRPDLSLPWSDLGTVAGRFPVTEYIGAAPNGENRSYRLLNPSQHERRLLH
jgi:hypothetical protein